MATPARCTRPGGFQSLQIRSHRISVCPHQHTLFYPEQKLSPSAGAGVKDLGPQGLTGRCRRQPLELTTSVQGGKGGGPGEMASIRERLREASWRTNVRPEPWRTTRGLLAEERGRRRMPRRGNKTRHQNTRQRFLHAGHGAVFHGSPRLTVVQLYGTGTVSSSFKVTCPVLCSLEGKGVDPGLRGLRAGGPDPPAHSRPAAVLCLPGTRWAAGKLMREMRPWGRLAKVRVALAWTRELAWRQKGL